MTGQTIKRRCPSCGQHVVVMKDGTLRVHRLWIPGSQRKVEECPGSKVKP